LIGITCITVTRPSLPIFDTPSVGRGLTSALARRDDAAEAAADRVLKRAVAKRSADQFATPERRERRVIPGGVEKVGITVTRPHYGDTPVFTHLRPHYGDGVGEITVTRLEWTPKVRQG
jgi:hypothetical protein